jgi:Fe-coproporphyrin III synthase
MSGLFQLTYHVTFRCNARCPFCFNLDKLCGNAENELSLEEIEKISRRMPRFSWLLISGGEPFLREDLSEIIEIFYRNNKVRHVTIPTNGILSGKIYTGVKNILDNCGRLTLTLSFSLDGIGEAHSALRNVPGCYEELLKSYEMIRPLREDKRLNVKFNTVLSNFNYSNIDKMIEEVRKLKPDMHTIDFIRGDLKDAAFGLPKDEDIDKIIETIKRNYKYYSGYSNLALHSFFARVFSGALQVEYLHLFQQILKRKTQVIRCGAFKRSLVLYPYGDVSFCEPLKPFANIRNYDYSYSRLLGSDRAREQAASIRNKKCYCYHPCNQYVNILFNPISLCKGVLRYAF